MLIQFLETGEQDLSEELRATATEILTMAHQEARAALPALSERYLVTVRYDRRVNEVTGEMGRLVTSRWLDWAVDPDRDRPPAEIARARLRDAFLHETHHAVRAQLLTEAKPHPLGPESPVDRSLLVPPRTDWLAQIAIEEGLANRFQRDLSPGGGGLGWDDYAGVPVAEWAGELVAAGRGSYLDWFFRLPDGRTHVGYRVGAYLVETAVRNTGRSAADLVGTPVSEVLRLAGYPAHNPGRRG
jgi:hypothetical protein